MDAGFLAATIKELVGTKAYFSGEFCQCHDYLLVTSARIPTLEPVRAAVHTRRGQRVAWAPSTIVRGPLGRRAPRRTACAEPRYASQVVDSMWEAFTTALAAAIDALGDKRHVRLIHGRHHARVKAMLTKHSGTCLPPLPPPLDDAELRLPLTAVLEPAANDAIMLDEVFGP